LHLPGEGTILYSGSSHSSTVSRLHINTMFDPVVAQQVPAEIVFQDAGMLIHDPKGKLMAEWAYAEIGHAFEPAQRRNRTLIIIGQPDIELYLGDDPTYHQLLDRVPRLRRKPLLIDRARKVIWAVVVAAAIAIVAVSAILWLLRSVSGWAAL
jgi:hypothetical protein